MMNKKNMFLIGLLILLQTAFAVQGVHASGSQPKQTEPPPPLVKLEPTDALYQSIEGGIPKMRSVLEDGSTSVIVSIGPGVLRDMPGYDDENMVNIAKVIIEEMHRQFQKPMPGDKAFAIIPEAMVEERRKGLRMKNFTTQGDMVRQLISVLNADYGIVGELGDGGIDFVEYDKEGKETRRTKEIFDPRKSKIVFNIIHGFAPPAMPEEQSFLKFPAGVSIVSLAYGSKDVLYALDDTNRILAFDTGTGELQRKIAEPTVKTYMIAAGANNTVIAGCQGELRIYNTTEDKIGNPKLIPVSGAALSIDCNNNQIAVGTSAGELAIYEMNGNRLLSLPQQRGPVNVVNFSPDGSRLLCAVADGLNIYDTTTGALIVSVPATGSSVLTAKFSPDQKHIAAGLEDGDIRLYSGQGELEWILGGHSVEDGSKEGHTKPVTSLAFTPNSLFLLSGSVDTTIRAWPVGEGLIGSKSTKTYEIDSIATRGSVNTLAYSPSGEQFASGQAVEKNVTPVVESGICLWSELREPRGTLRINTQAAFTILINGNKSVTIPAPTFEQQLVIGSLDLKTDLGVQLKDSNNQVVKAPVRLRTSAPLILTAEQIAVVKIKSMHTDSVNITFGTESFIVRPGDNDFSLPVKNGVRIGLENLAGTITDGTGKMITTLNVQAGTINLILKPLDRLQFKNNNLPGIIRPNVVAFNSKQSEFVVGYSSVRSGAVGGGSEAIAVIYNGKGEARSTLIGHTDAITNVTYNTDDSKIMTGTEKELRVWNASTGVLKFSIAQKSAVKAIVSHPTDPERFMVLTARGEIELYDLKLKEAPVATISPVTTSPVICTYDITGDQILVGREGELIVYEATGGRKLPNAPQAYQLPVAGPARINGNILELIEGTSVYAEIAYFGGRPSWKDYVIIFSNGSYFSASRAVDDINRFKLVPFDGGRARNVIHEDLELRKRQELVAF
jgi:WD40 repeat protein